VNPERLLLLLGHGGGAAVRGFWSGCPNLRLQDLLQISCFGDSITVGYGCEKASRVWPPECAARAIGLNTSRTVTTGSNIWNISYVSSSGGVTYDYGNKIYTLTASESDQNPRYAVDNFAGLLPYGAGKLYIARAEMNTNNSSGKHLALRWFGRDSSNVTVFTDRNAGGDNLHQDYFPTAYVISMDYAKSLAATLAGISIGGEIVGNETSGVGLIRSMEMYELTRGVAVINQGLSGDDAGEGLARVAQVTAWAPDVVVIAFGTNDIRAVPNDLETYLDNLTGICTAVQAVGSYPVLATIPPLASAQPNYTDVPTWNAAILALSASLDVGYWDRYSLLTLDDIADGRHPTRAGYLKLGQDLAARIAG